LFCQIKELYRRVSPLFSLAGLFVALLVLVFVTKVIISTGVGLSRYLQGGKYNKAVISVAEHVIVAFEAHKAEQKLTADTTMGDLTPYLPYVRVETAGDIDNYYTLVRSACTAKAPCLRMKDGSVLQYYPYRFGGTATTNAIIFQVDPDGKVTDDTTNGLGKAAQLILYNSGRIFPRGSHPKNTCTGDGLGCYDEDPNADPPWLDLDGES
jgi:hypothetical protein